MGEEVGKATPEVDYRPFVIADADTGHRENPQVCNLIRHFVEVGIPRYRIEDQKPGAKKTGSSSRLVENEGEFHGHPVLDDLALIDFSLQRDHLETSDSSHGL